VIMIVECFVSDWFFVRQIVMLRVERMGKIKLI